jgi:hypothetical protein
MKYVEAFSMEHPAQYRGGPLGNILPGENSLFLGGGITGCFDWQAEMCRLLKDADDLVVLNPRRKNWPINDPKATDKQIRWEYEHLQTANMIMFWFAPETLCPITLFEYGKWLVRNKPLFVGCDPQYKRLLDVQVQTALERPFQKVYTSLEEVADSILLHLDRYTATE